MESDTRILPPPLGGWEHSWEEETSTQTETLFFPTPPAKRVGMGMAWPTLAWIGQQACCFITGAVFALVIVHWIW